MSALGDPIDVPVRADGALEVDKSDAGNKGSQLNQLLSGQVLPIPFRLTDPGGESDCDCT